jgi:AbrB family looped-hinge helix DNA binding protein
MKIGERGQITIPQRIRERYGLEPSTEIEIVEEDGKLVLRKRLPEVCPIDRFIGVLGGGGQRTDDLIEDLRGR